LRNVVIGKPGRSVGQPKRVAISGLADVEFNVSEKRRVVDLDDETTYVIRVVNSGSKEATRLLISAELSKNIVRGLAAYRELLITEPQWRGRVTHLAFAYPSRHDLPEYREYTASVQRMAREIVDEFGTEDWNPLVLQVNDDYARSLAAYQLADVLLRLGCWQQSLNEASPS